MGQDYELDNGHKKNDRQQDPVAEDLDEFLL
jgi:hypothetical protein